MYTYVGDVHEGAVYTKTQFVRSFVVYIRARAHVDARTQRRTRAARTCAARVSVCVCASGTYVWVLTFHDLSRSFQRASKRPESAQIDKRNNRGREIEGLDLIRRESEREGEGAKSEDTAAGNAVVVAVDDESGKMRGQTTGERDGGRRTSSL